MMPSSQSTSRSDGGGQELQPRRWDARLELVFRADPRRTTLAHRRHHGPLGVQRPFYPEPDGTCHVYLLHPPGGVAGGDTLTIDGRLGSDARALLTTPAATKLYRTGTGGPCSSQTQTFTVGRSACLEWLPQETIVFDGAHSRLTTRVELEPDADFLGWEVMCLGRPASGERFEHGSLRQAFEIHRGQVPLFIERSRYEGGSPVLHEPWGMSGQPTVGTFVCVTDGAQGLVERLRGALASVNPRDFAVSQLRNVLICRYLGPRTEQAQAGFRTAWRIVREAVYGRAACTPRIWLT